MTKVSFEIDQEILANANAYVARHGGSLDKLVSSFLSALDPNERASEHAPDSIMPVILEVSAGRISLVEGARILGMQDAGYLLQALRDLHLLLPQLDESDTRALADATTAAFAECLLEPIDNIDIAQSRATPAVSE